MSDPVAWCVAFASHACVADTPWWLRGLHPDFRHVFAYRQADRVSEDAPAQTLVVNQIGNQLQVGVAPLDVGTFTRNLTQDGKRVVLLVVRHLPPPRPSIRGPMSCVETVKSLLGIRSPWIITPRQLWRHLRAGDAKFLL